MKGDGPQPEPLVGPVDQPGPFGVIRVLAQFGAQVPEEAAEGEDFQGHAADEVLKGRRVVESGSQVPFDPGEGTALGGGGGNPEGYGGAGPGDEAIDKAFHENENGQIGHHHPEDNLQVSPGSDVGHQDEPKHCEQGHREMTLKKIHVLSPRFRWSADTD